MASLFARGDGKKRAWSIACRSSTGARRTIYLGRIGAHAARRMKPRVETLEAAVISGTPPDHDTGMWLRELSDKMHQKLAKVGLVAPRQPEETAPTLEGLSIYSPTRNVDRRPPDGSRRWTTCWLSSSHRVSTGSGLIGLLIAIETVFFAREQPLRAS